MIYSRTAYGCDATGKHLYMIVIDKSTSRYYGASSGCSTTVMCQILKDLYPDVTEIINMDAGGSAQMMRYLVKTKQVEYTRDTGRATAGCIAFIGKPIASQDTLEPSQPSKNEQIEDEPQKDEEEPMEENKPQNQPEMSPVEGWNDPEPGAGTTIVERISALMSVKSIITLAFVGTYLAMVLQGQQVPSLFENILTMIVSFFFGYQFRKAEK
jgi:hypothetical protein